jgi:hypothetical protein
MSTKKTNTEKFNKQSNEKIPGLRILSRAEIAYLCLVLCLTADSSKATSIVARWLPGTIAVGADSGGTFRGRGLAPHLEPVCKIYQSGDLYFAVAGLVGDSVTHFSSADIAAAASRRRGSIKQKAEIAIRELRRKIPRELRILKTADPDWYRKIATGEEDFVSILFFGLDKGGNVIAVGFGIKAMVSADGSIRTIADERSCPGSNCPTGGYIFELG